MSMRNKILTLTRSSIPYVKELRPITKSIAGAIVMQQLDYLFNLKPDGFYKFLEPCSHELYREGDSWCEEIGCTPDEFRAAFDKIGLRYKSKTEYLQAGADKFGGLLYCSYFDKVKGETWYFRNHERVDAVLDTIIAAGSQPVQPGKWKNPSTGDGKNHSGNWHFPATEMEIASHGNGESHLESVAKTTAQRLKDNNTTIQAEEAVVVASAATLLLALQAEDIPPKIARKLLDQYGEAAVRQQVAWLPQRLHDPQKGTRAGLLRRSIEEAWTAPAGKKPLPRPKVRTGVHKPSEANAEDVAAMRAVVRQARQKTRLGQEGTS